MLLAEQADRARLIRQAQLAREPRREAPNLLPRRLPQQLTGSLRGDLLICQADYLDAQRLLAGNAGPHALDDVAEQRRAHLCSAECILSRCVGWWAIDSFRLLLHALHGAIESVAALAPLLPTLSAIIDAARLSTSVNVDADEELLARCGRAGSTLPPAGALAFRSSRVSPCAGGSIGCGSTRSTGGAMYVKHSKARTR